MGGRTHSRPMLAGRRRANLRPDNGYPAVWSAKLITLTQMQVAAIEPVNVLCVSSTTPSTAS